MDNLFDVIIIGSGPAGYTSAIYTGRANLKTLVIEGFERGGQLMTTTDIENFPGFPEGTAGPDLMENFRKQAERFGPQMITVLADKVDLQSSPFRVVANNKEYFGKTVIVATGASARYLGIESENKYKGRGVSACATCDGFFYRGKNVIVVGGGDTAMEEANFLTRFAEKVYLVHRRDEFRASKIMTDRVKQNPKIELLTSKTIDEVLGNEAGAVNGVKLKDTKSGEISEMPIDGIFVAIGHKPNTDIFDGQLDMDETGYLVTQPNRAATNIPGVFAAGDVKDSYYRQAITASGSGCQAALEAERYLESLEG